MAHVTMHLLAPLVVLLAFLLPMATAASDITYCSSVNTGSDGQAKNWMYQSYGWCTQECASYAYAVLLGGDCWCSNYAPAAQQNMGDCNAECPGFPDNKCGSTDKKLYAYVSTGVKPSGTKGAPTPSSPANPSSAPPSPSSTTVHTVTMPSSAPLDPSAPSSVAPTTLRTTSGSGNSATQSPYSNVQVITESGRIVTKTVYASLSIGGATSAPALTEDRHKGTNVGAIVGGVVGGLAGLAAVAGAIFFVLWRRRRQRQQDEDGQSGVQRNTSTMSKSGLLRSEKPPQPPPPIATNFQRRSRHLGDNDSISPISGSDRRNSRPYIFDQRLNPSAIMMNLDNTSRGSFASMDDSRDYGRALNVRNPDPDPQ